MDKIASTLIVIGMTYGAIYMLVKAYEAWKDCKRLEKDNQSLKRKSDAYHRRTLEMIEFGRDLPTFKELREILDNNDITSHH